MNRSGRTYLGIALLAATASARAQPPSPSPSPAPGSWTGNGQLSFLQTTGNTETSVYGIAAEAKYKGIAPWSFLGKGFLNRGSVDGAKNLKNLGVSARGARSLSARADIFIEAAYFEDFFAGIDSRKSIEAGLSRKLRVDEPHLLQVEGGFGLARETRVPDDTQEFAFLRAGFTYKWVISKTADFQNQANLVASLKQGDDWRLNNVASLTAALSSRFSLKLSYGFTRLNLPTPGKERTDTVTQAALVAKF